MYFLIIIIIILLNNLRGELSDVWAKTATLLLIAGACASEAVDQLIPAATMTMDAAHTSTDASELHSRRSLMQADEASSKCSDPVIAKMVTLVNAFRKSYKEEPVTCVNHTSKIAWRKAKKMCTYVSSSCAVIFSRIVRIVFRYFYPAN